MKFVRNVKKSIKENKRIMKYLEKYWIIWIVIVTLSNLLILLELAVPLIIKFLIDVVLIEKNFGMLNIIMFVFIAIGFATVAMRYLYAYLEKKMSLSILFDIRNELFHHIENMDVSEFHEKSLGDFLSRMLDDIGAIGDYVSLIFEDLILNAITIALIFSISIVLDWKLTLLSLITIPFIVFAQKHYGKIIRNMFNRYRIISAEFLDFLQERLSLISLIKIFSKERSELEEQKKKSKEIMKMDLQLTKMNNFVAAVVGMLIFFALLFVLWYGGLEVIRGVLTIGTLIAVYTYIGMLFDPIQTIADININLQTTMVSIKRIFSILDIKPNIADKKGAKRLKNVMGSIQFRNVTFGYKKKTPILKNIKFTLIHGETIGIVGTSGSGKSTIARLLVRLYDPEKGTILIDGHNIKNVKLDSLRDNISYVKQDNMLFKASIKENISYGNPGATQKEIEEAAKTADAHSFIMKLPKKYNTIIGPGGVELSGGQMQRLSIARGLLKEAKIIVLDEATSELDVKTEIRVQDAIKEKFKGKSMLIIAHRLSTLNMADRIFVLDKGRIVESGTFEMLMKRKGLFYNIYNLQMKKMKEKMR